MKSFRFRDRKRVRERERGGGGGGGERSNIVGILGGRKYIKIMQIN